MIALVDRTPDYSDDSTILGEDFSDSRMYKIENHKAVRIEGGKDFPEITKTSEYEANMGDAQTLKKFIDSCKDDIFKRLKAGGESTSQNDLTLKGKEQNFDPSTVTDLQLGALMVEEQRDAASSARSNDQVLSCFDLSKIETVFNFFILYKLLYYLKKNNTEAYIFL